MISTVWTKRDSAWRFYCPLFDILVLFFIVLFVCVWFVFCFGFVCLFLLVFKPFVSTTFVQA